MQEAITNVIKHADASICDISLVVNEQWLELTVKDNGKNNQKIISGNGLNGMKERIQLVDGKISFSNNKRGFLLQIKLPNYMI